MSKFWDGAGLIAKKALTWACYGAIALGVLAVPFAGVGGAISTALSVIGIDTAAGTAVLGGALFKGALLGGLFGAIKGTADLSTDLEDLQADRSLKQQEQAVVQERAVARRSQLMQAQSQAQEPLTQSSTALSPNIGHSQTPANPAQIARG